jgi:hypothetical protein
MVHPIIYMFLEYKKIDGYKCLMNLINLINKIFIRD